MKDNKLNINKTKYRYLMDNLKLFPIRPIITYTIPVPNDPTVDESKQEFFDRKYPDVKITNLHFKHMIDKTAKALIAYGVKKGDIVTICQTNTPEMFYMDYALNKIGAKANFIYPNVTAEEMKYYMEELDSKYMFILDDDPIRKNVKEATKGTDIKIISSSVIESFPELFKRVASKKMPKNIVELNNEIKWEEFIENGKRIKEVKEDSYVPNDVCSYIHTSGTSSIPKAVKISNENDNQVVKNHMEDGIDYKEGKKVIQTIPQFVQYGKATNHLMLCNNICVIILPEMEPKNYYDMIHKYRPDYSFATPSHARELMKRNTDMSNSKIFIFGGDGFDDVEEKINNYFKVNGSNAVAYQGYGATEFSACAIYTRKSAHKLGSVGVMSGKDNYYVLIDPDTKEEIYEPNKIGELCLTGTGLTLGYAGNSEKQNNEVFKKHSDGKTYLHTGDYISVDEDGFFYYHGRMKNIIKRKSFAFSPDEIVKAVMLHPSVSNCVVIPKYSSTEGEVPSAHIVLNDNENAESILNEIINIVNDNVQEFHRPTNYKIRQSIPITRNNKIDFNALKIEDTALLLEGVINAEIKECNDGTYDYKLYVEVDSNLADKATFVDELNNYIKKISNILKFNMGTIDYKVKYMDASYQDKDKYTKKSVKHI